MSSNLPSGWSIASIEILTLKISNGLTTKQGKPTNGIPVTRIETISNGTINLSKVGYVDSRLVIDREKWRLLKGDILFSHINSDQHLGKTALFNLIDFELLHGMNLLVIRTDSEMVSADFMNFWLNFLRFSGHFQSIAQHAVNQSSINIRKLEQVKVSLPPRAEQTRIVEKLEELLSDLDAGVAELKAAQKKLRQYRQSLLKAAVEGALTAEWRKQQRPPLPNPSPTGGEGLKTETETGAAPRNDPVFAPLSPRGRGAGGEGNPETGAQLLERILTERRARWEAKQLAKFNEQGKAPPKDWQEKYPAPVKPDTSGLPGLPEGWVWSFVGQCFNVGVGATPSRKDANYWNGEIPWVSSGEVQFNRIGKTKEHITQQGLKNSSTQINPAGSVMLGMIGEGKTRGQVAILEIEAANNQNCASIWVSETDIPTEYVYFWLWSQYEETRRGSSGNNQPALNKSIVERISFPLAPLDETDEIVRLLNHTLDAIFEQEMSIDFSLKQSTAQRQNILRAAFSGQLVPQDPNDEPASVLLERIRAERAARENQPKMRKRNAKEAAR